MMMKVIGSEFYESGRNRRAYSLEIGLGFKPFGSDASVFFIVSVHWLTTVSALIVLKMDFLHQQKNPSVGWTWMGPFAR